MITNKGGAKAEGETPIITLGVNLKMYFGYHQTFEWCSEVARLAHDHPALVNGVVELFVLPSAPMVPRALEILSPAGVAVGAQNLWVKDSGPFTGELSGSALGEAGCGYVAVGHMERRRLFHEDDRTVGAKVSAAARNGLTPVLCVGEADHGTPTQAADLCIAKLGAALEAANENAGFPLIVAYEPVWAIGSANPAPPGYVRAVAFELRKWLDRQDAVSPGRLLYGGSAGPGLMVRLFGAVDGLFLGRFAHDPTALRAILDEAMKLAGSQ